jgi:hypothetical protein
MYWRERGDTAFKPFTAADYERVTAAFEKTGREIDLRIAST